MYTIVPFRCRREMTRPMMNSLFDDRFFRSFFDMGDMVGSAGFRVDVKDNGESYSLEAELPGVKQEDINLSVENDVLTISADVNTNRREERENYLYSERRSGHMERAFNLEGINQEAISAKYENGVLTVNLPKNAPEAEKKARRIAIGGAPAEEAAEG